MRGKPEPDVATRRALRAQVPPNQRCEICGYRTAPERHFVTVPLPRGFSRVCDEDLSEIKETIRKRALPIVAEVFAEHKRKASQF